MHLVPNKEKDSPCAITLKKEKRLLVKKKKTTLELCNGFFPIKHFFFLHKFVSNKNDLKNH
jgi:hypothetical protein